MGRSRAGGAGAARDERLLTPRLRTARPDDVKLLRTLVFEAAFWRRDVERPPLDRALALPKLARYVEDFGSPGDFGLVAEEGPEALGAAWWRNFPAHAPGYGFVDETTPELSVAVLPDHRGRGIGSALLSELKRKACEGGIERLSLSVERSNPAVALYERLGFRTVECERDALTMAIRLEPSL